MIPIQNKISAHENASYYTNFAKTPLIATHVFSYLNAKELGNCLSVCKQWNEYASNEALWNNLVPEMAFGPREWSLYFGDIGNAPALPRVIYQILDSSCPIWPNKKVCETHLLTFIPQTVNGQPLTLKSLGELVQKPLQGSITKYTRFYIGECEDQPIHRSHWTLLSFDVIPDSRNQSYINQQKLVENYHDYEVPNVLDAAVSLFVKHVRSGIRLYSDGTYTRCQEKYGFELPFAVGGFSRGGLSVIIGIFHGREDNGVGVQRKFFFTD